MLHSGCGTMNFIYMIVTVLATVVLTIASSECNLSESNGTHLCRGEVGQPLILYLSKAAKSEIRLVKDEQYLVLKRDISGEITTDEGYNFERIDVGTFKLNNGWKNYSGDYKMEEFNSDGKLLKKITLRLEIYEMDSANTSDSGPPGSNPDVGTTVPVQTVVVASVSAATLFLLVTFTLVILRLQKKPRHPANTSHSENDVIYSEVRVINKTRGHRQREP